MKLSVVIPTYNEEKSISYLIDSLLNQTLLPNEIIISDNNSTDRTTAILNEYIIKNPNKIKILNRKGNCRGSGRNSGINEAKNIFVCLIDSGTIPHNNWLKNFSDIHNKNKKKLIFGNIIPTYNNTISRCFANIVSGKTSKNDSIQYSVSSIFMQKEIWKNLGKFPESETGEYVVEDLRFINKVKKSNIDYTITNEAPVFWKSPSKIKKIVSRYREYSYGAIKNKFTHTWHYKLILNYVIIILISILINYFLSINILICFIFLLLLRSLSYLYKKDKYKKKYFLIFKDIFSTFYVLSIIDFSTVLGLLDYLKNKFIYKK